MQPRCLQERSTAPSLGYGEHGLLGCLRRARSGADRTSVQPEPGRPVKPWRQAAGVCGVLPPCPCRVTGPRHQWSLSVLRAELGTWEAGQGSGLLGSKCVQLCGPWGLQQFPEFGG